MWHKQPQALGGIQSGMAQRRTMNVSLSQGLKAWVESQVRTGHYGTASEYVRHLLRQAQAMSSREAVDEALLAAGPSQPLTPVRWRRMTTSAREQLAAA